MGRKVIRDEETVAVVGCLCHPVYASVVSVSGHCTSSCVARIQMTAVAAAESPDDHVIPLLRCGSQVTCRRSRERGSVAAKVFDTLIGNLAGKKRETQGR